MQDAVVAAARAQEAIVPGDSADAAFVATHRLDALVFGGVPNLQFARMRSHSEKSTIAGPLDAGDAVVRADVAQLGHLAVHGGPEVDAGAEADGKHVLRGPVDQIQIEVVLEAGGVEDLEWLLGDDSLLFVLLRKQLFLVESAVDGQGDACVLVAGRHGRLEVGLLLAAAANRVVLAEIVVEVGG